jgi:hypothetical protein
MELHGHKLLLELADYGKIEGVGASERLGSIAVTTAAVFFLLWAIEYAAYAVYGMIGGELFTKKEWRVKFGRHTMDIVAMVIFSYMGFEALGTAPFHGWDTLHAMKSSKGMLEYGHARAYVFSESAQRLCVWQIAYQLKNFCDAVIHNDGPLFLAHHIVTGLLSVSSLDFHLCALQKRQGADIPFPQLRSHRRSPSSPFCTSTAHISWGFRKFPLQFYAGWCFLTRSAACLLWQKNSLFSCSLSV